MRVKVKELLPLISYTGSPSLFFDVENNQKYFVTDYTDELLSGLLEHEVGDIGISITEAFVLFVITIRPTSDCFDDKANFVKGLGQLLHDYARRTSVAKIDCVKTAVGTEFAVITFDNGEQKMKNITGDSCLAIMNDIYKTLL